MLAITSYEDDARGDDEHGRDAYAIPIARISAACQAALVTLSVPSAPGAEPESETITTDVQLELPSNLTEASIKDLAESVKALHLSNEQKQALDTLKGTFSMTKRKVFSLELRR